MEDSFPRHVVFEAWKQIGYVEVDEGNDEFFPTLDNVVHSHNPPIVLEREPETISRELLSQLAAGAGRELQDLLAVIAELETNS